MTDLKRSTGQVKHQTAGRASVSRAVAWAPGTWGELVQGIVEGEDVLLTCPVNLYTLAVARSFGEGRWPCPAIPAECPSALGWRSPAGRPRTAAALAALSGNGQVWLRTSLRPGAGMASSTADICAALAAVAAASGSSLTAADLFARCLRLEPTDGLMFPGIALVDHRRGRRVQLLGEPPPLAILGLDPGGVVPTAQFNRRADLSTANREKEPAVRAALEMAITAMAKGDPAALAEAATQSAQAHQKILPNPLWEQAMGLARSCGALGVNVAHSGSVLGILFDFRRTDVEAVRQWLERRLGLAIRPLKLASDGVKVKVRR